MEIENIQESLLASQLANNSKHQAPNTLASLTNSLTQALQNRDLDIIKFIFSNSDQKLIADTLNGFNNPDMYGKFLEICNSMIDSFPNETEQVLNWLYNFLTLKQGELRTSGLLVGSPLLNNNYLKVKNKTITPLLDVKHKLEFLMATNGERVLSDTKKGFGEAMVTIDERMVAENGHLIDDHKQAPKRKQKDDEIEDEDDDEEHDEVDEDESDNIEEEEEEMMHDYEENDRKGFENNDPMNEEDAELEKELEKYEKREKQLKPDKKAK